MALLQISEPGQSPDPHQRRIAVGIDLGTTHSLVAAVRHGVAECLPDAQGRVILPDPMPEKGYYYRSDHFPFAKQGVPALASGAGIDYVGKPADYGKKIRAEYIAHLYHQPADVVRPDWDMSGAVQDLQFYGLIGYRVSMAGKYPEWKAASEFKGVREEQLKAAASR